jgi:hypothetical protein
MVSADSEPDLRHGAGAVGETPGVIGMVPRSALRNNVRGDRHHTGGQW